MRVIKLWLGVWATARCTNEAPNETGRTRQGRVPQISGFGRIQRPLQYLPAAAAIAATLLFTVPLQSRGPPLGYR